MGTRSVWRVEISFLTWRKSRLIKRTTITSIYFGAVEISFYKAISLITLGSIRGRKIPLWVAQPRGIHPLGIQRPRPEGSMICQARYRVYGTNKNGEIKGELKKVFYFHASVRSSYSPSGKDARPQGLCSTVVANHGNPLTCSNDGPLT
jgi:hypothetical protein